MKCAFHPDRETGLSCARCDRAVCVDCVRHTSIGSRCLECIGLRPSGPEREKVPMLGIGDVGSGVNETTRRHYLGVFLGVLFLNMLMAPLVLLPGLVVAVIIGAVRKLESAGRFLGGAIFFIGCWAVVIPTVLPLAKKSQPTAEMHIAAGTGVFIFFVAILVVPLFWRPARRCAEQLVEQGRGISAGLLLGSAFAGTAISLMGALLFLFLSLYTKAGA